MDNINLIESFEELKEVKNIDRSSIISLMQDVFRTVISKKYGSSDNFTIIVNPTKGDLEIWRNRLIVENDFEDFDENIHIKLSDALLIASDFEVGEDLSDEMKITDFGRRAISTIKQILKTKVIELSKESMYKKYIDRVGELITGDVHQILRNEVIILDDEGVEMCLPKNEQLSSDFFKKGESVRAIISSIEMKNNSIQVLLSRKSNLFLEKLFEAEIPEVFDGLVTVKLVAREPGFRAKVAVESYDDRVDPVGICIGVRGSRIHPIVKELGNEGIDIINYTTNKELLILRSINAPMNRDIEIDEELKTANIILKNDELSSAIGRGGVNIKLASKLTGYKINVYTDKSHVADDDVALEDFKDEIDGWVIDELVKIGCDTAKSVLKIPFDELVYRTDLEEETVREVIDILQSEFN